MVDVKGSVGQLSATAGREFVICQDRPLREQRKWEEQSYCS
jgi:hypothetical protein